MCGISVIRGSSASAEVCKKSLEKIVYRGSRVFEIQEIESNHIVMGANRLPIQGRLTGVQPVFNEDKSVRAVQNGEIFNYHSLKDDLLKKGHIFHTDSDTELYVHLWEEFGTGCVAHIDSEMFAFCIYDTRNNDLYVARDRRGVKPLYYGYHTDGSIHFASEVKQLVQFEDIDKVYDFPKGYYFYKGKFVCWAKKIKIGNGSKNEKECIDTLTTALVQAVKKRVDTDLPIGVFLSGGVDSSLIMEIATRFHPNVTAIILGKPGALDYEYALRLCKDRNYTYHVVHPEEQWEEKIESLVYHTETYEPLIIRQGLANDLCSQAAQQLDLHIVLLGEGSDELFAGYNEFGTLSDSLINAGCYQLLNHLDKGHFKRVDRMAMRYTLETRCPFFDDAVVENAFSVSGSLKVKKEFHNVTMKYILRKVAEQFLPDYIVWRYKLPFANGAGMSVGNNFKKGDGSLSHRIKRTSRNQLSIERTYCDKYHLDTLEEKYLFDLYQKTDLQS